MGNHFHLVLETPIVDGSETGYLKSVCDYVRLNPVRAKLIATEQPLKDYRWSRRR